MIRTTSMSVMRSLLWIIWRVSWTATGGHFGQSLREFLSGDDLLLLAQIGETFGKLPSEILERGGEPLAAALAWQIDAVAAVRLANWKAEQMKVEE